MAINLSNGKLLSAEEIHSLAKRNYSPINRTHQHNHSMKKITIAIDGQKPKWLEFRFLRDYQ